MRDARNMKRETWNVKRCEASLGLKAEFDLAGGRDFGAAALGAPALHVHGHWIARDMRPGRFDVYRQGGGIAAQPLWADARLINRIEKFSLDLRHLGIRIFRAKWARGGFLCQGHAEIR